MVVYVITLLKQTLLVDKVEAAAAVVCMAALLALAAQVVF
jgi:hypothetical protein